MASRKQTVTLSGTMSKGKAISSIGGTVLPLAIDQPHNIEEIGSSSAPGAAANAQAPLLQYEDQFIQMLADMKEQTKEQQTQSDCVRE